MPFIMDILSFSFFIVGLYGLFLTSQYFKVQYISDNLEITKKRAILDEVSKLLELGDPTQTNNNEFKYISTRSRPFTYLVIITIYIDASGFYIYAQDQVFNVYSARYSKKIRESIANQIKVVQCYF